MQRFSIFIKEKKFYWTTNKIIYSILLSVGAILLFKVKVLQIEENWLDKGLIKLMVSTFLIGIIISFFNLGKAKPLEGRLDGFLEFKNDGVSIQNETFSLEQLKDISISNNDYYGKSTGSNRGNFGPALSNGTDNFITLKLYSGETKHYQFELYNSNDFQKVRKELIHLYLNNKIEFSNLSNVLGENSKKEIAELKLEIEKTAFQNNITSQNFPL